HRREDGGARADDHARRAVANPPPFAGPFDVAERGVKDGDAFKLRTEPGAALPANPKREGDFGDQDNGSPAARQRVLHGAQIDLGRAAAGATVQKLDAEFAQFETRANGGESAVLFGIEGVGRRYVARIEGILGGIERLLPALEVAPADGGPDRRAGGAGKLEQEGA